jgi:hypothetical protein
VRRLSAKRARLKERREKVIEQAMPQEEQQQETEQTSE